MDALEFSLTHFEGTLELLLSLIQKRELDLLTIPIKELTEQLGKKIASIDSCADTMALTATLLLLKSRKLLPTEDTHSVLDQEGQGRLSLIEHLLSYCRLKEAAAELTQREKNQSAHFMHNPIIPEAERAIGIESLSLHQLATQLQAVLQRSQAKLGHIEPEKWQVQTQIQLLQQQLSTEAKYFTEIFCPSCCRLELIVKFLALLELMKEGKVYVMQKDDQWVMKLIC